MRTPASRFGLALVACSLFIGSRAQAQTAELHLESGALYEDVPFVLALVAKDFDDDPQPAQPALEIAGCRVTPLGVSPSVFSFTQNINGKISEVKRVTLTYRYRVDAPSAGRYQVPALTIEQGSKRATTRPAQFTVRAISTTRDMQIRLSIPERAVWVGEVFDAYIDWYLNRDPSNQHFAIPLFDSEDWTRVDAPPGASSRTLAFQVGSREVQLPYTVDKQVLDGVQYTRFRFHARVTPLRAGALALPPPRVVADLKIGTTRDRFGFPADRTQTFKAEGKATTLEVRAPPMKDRPPSFENAVGSSFSIDVQASNTVVKVGEPVELRITLRTNSPLEGITLPPLDKGGGLPTDLFDVAEEPPAGEIQEDGKSKLFRVTIRPKSKKVTAIPPIAFSYFNPEKGTYETIHSREIALSVEGSAVVGASDVVSAAGTKTAGAGKPSGGAGKPAGSGSPRSLGLVGADLSLSNRADTLRAVLSTDAIRPLLFALYFLPLLVLAVRLWQVRTGARRAEHSEVKRRLREVERELEAAKKAPARDAAPRIVSALRALARTVDRPAGERISVIENLETVAYDPRASSEPLAESRLSDVRDVAREWVDAHRASQAGKPQRTATAVAILLASGITAASPPAHAATDTDEKLRAARDAYTSALAEEHDRDARASKFARAEALYRDLAEKIPNRPELLADWGNAALGARDYGWATLAYRRALLLDSGNQRARRGLAQLRSTAPDWVPRAPAGGALETLFFWHHRLSKAQRQLLGAAAFALAVLLLVPWGKRKRLRRRLAILPALVWLAMITSVLLQRDATNDVVVLHDGVVLRAADSPGAPPTLSQPLPSGTEATALEERQEWTRVALADGTEGWLPSHAVEHVVE